MVQKALLGEDMENIPVLAHDGFGQRHFFLEARICRGQVKTRGRFSKIHIIPLRHAPALLPTLMILSCLFIQML